MRILILAMLLTIGQAPVPVGPRQAPKSDSGVAHHQAPASKTLPQKPTEQPVGEKAAASNPTPPNTEQAISVRKLPPVSVSRDWADWVLWAGSSALVVVGIVGICVAVKTLKALKVQSVIMRRQTRHIARQAVSLRRQTTHLRTAAEAARDNAIAAKDAAIATRDSVNLIRNKERPRVRIDSPDLTFRPQPSSPAKTAELSFEVSCYGSTNAFVIGGWEQIWMSAKADSNTTDNERLPLVLPKVLKPDYKEINREPLDWLTDSFIDELEPMTDVKKVFFLHLTVVILYNDVFQTATHWGIESHYVWRVTYFGSKEKGMWAQSGPMSTDTETEQPN